MNLNVNSILLLIVAMVFGSFVQPLKEQRSNSESGQMKMYLNDFRYSPYLPRTLESTVEKGKNISSLMSGTEKEIRTLFKKSLSVEEYLFQENDLKLLIQIENSWVEVDQYGNFRRDGKVRKLTRDSFRKLLGLLLENIPYRPEKSEWDRYVMEEIH